MTTSQLPVTLIEAASWTLATDLIRRHPDLQITRYHPGGGQYDCLAIRSDGGTHIDLNRTGRIHIHAIEGDGTPNWEPAEWATYLASDPRDFVNLLEERVRLPHVDVLPASTPRVLSNRILAALARLHVFGSPVDIRMSTIDESATGGGPADWLANYPAVERMTTDQPFGFWRATSANTEFVIETESSTLHRPDGSTTALGAKYDELGRNFERLLGLVLTSA